MYLNPINFVLHYKDWNNKIVCFPSITLFQSAYYPTHIADVILHESY